MKRLFLLFLLFLAGCATTPPSDPENICAIFREKPDWHKALARGLEEMGRTGTCADRHDVSGIEFPT